MLVIGFSIAALYAVDSYQLIRFTPAPGDIELITSGSFAVALIYVGCAYSGCNAAPYLTGELENPAKTLPLVLAVGTGVVMLSYVLLSIGQINGLLRVGFLTDTAD